MALQIPAGSDPYNNYVTQQPVTQQGAGFDDPSQGYSSNPNHQNYNNPIQSVPQKQSNPAEATNQSVKTNTGELSPNPDNLQTISSTPVPDKIPVNTYTSSPFNNKDTERDDTYKQTGDQNQSLAKVKVSINENTKREQTMCKNQLPNIIIQIPGMPQCPSQWSMQCNSAPPACKKARTMKESKSRGFRPTNFPNEPIISTQGNTIQLLNPSQPINQMGSQMYEPGLREGTQFTPMSMLEASTADSMFRNQSLNQRAAGYNGGYPLIQEMNNFPQGGQDFNDAPAMNSFPMYYPTLETMPMFGQMNPQQYISIQYPVEPGNTDEYEIGKMYNNQEHDVFMDPIERFPAISTGYSQPQEKVYPNILKSGHSEKESISTETSSSECSSHETAKYMQPNNPCYAEPRCCLEPRQGAQMFSFGKRSTLNKDQQTSKAQMLAPKFSETNDKKKGDPVILCEESIQCEISSPSPRGQISFGPKRTSEDYTATNKCRRNTKPSLIPKRVPDPSDGLDPNIALELEMQRQQILLQQELQNQRCTMILQQELQNQRQTLLLQRHLQNQRQALLLQQELQNREQSLLLQNDLSSVRKTTGNGNDNNCRNRSRKKYWSQNRTRATPEYWCRQPLVSIKGGSRTSNCSASQNQNPQLRSDGNSLDPLEVQIFNSEVQSSNCASLDQANIMRYPQVSNVHAEYAMKIARLKEHNRLPMLSTIPPTERNSFLPRSRKKRGAQPAMMVRGCRCDITSSCLSSGSPPCEFPSITTLGLQQLQKDKCAELSKFGAPGAGAMSVSKVIQFEAKFGKSDGDEG